MMRVAVAGGAGRGRYCAAVQTRSSTGSMESRADPGAIVAVLSDPARIPDWAPGFADEVAEAGQSRWRATKDGQDFILRVATNPDARTVDYLREISPGREGGAYLRVIPRPGGGSVVIMTLPVAPGADPADAAATARGELSALVSLAEGS